MDTLYRAVLDRRLGVRTYDAPATRIDWRAPFGCIASDPAWQRRIAIGGLLMLVVPPLGWLMALGFRSLFGTRLADGCSPVLPSWRGNLRLLFRRGAASSGVILGYLTPVLAVYWALGAQTAATPLEHWPEAGAFAAAVVVFPPVAIPLLPIVYGLRYPWLHFSAMEIGGLLLLFLAAVALLPAAFLQVARHRRFRAAFNVVAALRLIASVPRLYLEAWIVSLAVSAIAVLIVPLTPWLLFWSYLVISHVFLQVLSAADGR